MILFSKLFELWHDPVWGAVIAAIIFAVLAAMVAPIRRSLIAFAKNIFDAPPVRATIRVTVDSQFPHVPSISIDAQNRGWRTVELSSLDFITKGRWDMPDPRREGVVTPVYPFLHRDTSFVKISEQQGSVANLPLGIVIGPFRSAVVTARLVTDHAPYYAMGVFPFHLGVVIKWKQGKSQRTLSDIIVSLHGGTPLSSLEIAAPIFGLPSPTELRQSANAVLSIALEGAYCPVEIRDALKSVVASPLH
jgi:hypothetical protein